MKMVQKQGKEDEVDGESQADGFAEERTEEIDVFFKEGERACLGQGALWQKGLEFAFE